MASEEQNMTSAPGSGLKLLDLAPEIVQNVIKCATKEDLPNIRLASKVLDRYAVTELFRDILISPEEEHIVTWTSISQHERLRQLPRNAIIYTHTDIEGGGSDEYEEPGEDFEEGLAALAQFPNIDSLAIGFTPECVGNRDTHWFENVNESVSKRTEMLESIFQAIKDRAANTANRRIRKLTIVNLQNCPIPGFTRSDLFRDVMSQLEELHLQITEERNEHGPDHDYTRVELQTFPEYLVSDWLKPISENLRALSIGSLHQNWGPFPGHFKPIGLSLPKLETLALRYYTLAHDDDLTWLLSIKSLKELVLHNCMVVSRIRIDPDNMEKWKLHTGDWDALPERTDDSDWPQFAYHGKWSEFFARIADELPNLVDFCFNDGSPYRTSEVFPQRYLVFDNGILPTHWPEARRDGRIYAWTNDPFPNFHKERLVEDEKSLYMLLGECRRRATGKGIGI